VAEKRVPVLAPDPKTGALRFATVNESHAEAVVKAGGKVLSAKEAIAEQQHADYEAKGTAEKVIGGTAALAAGPIAGNALAGTGAITVAPEVQALQQGEATALTGGLDQVAVHHALEATAGKEAAKAYAKNQREIAEANPGFKTAGELAGFAAAAYGSGGVGGAARAIPGVGISALGGAAEGVAARALGGVAARGVLGRAIATSGELAARGAVEGALDGAANEVTEADLGDRDVTADKLFASMGHGALYGGLGGAVLGGTGSLAKSAAVGSFNAARGGLSRVMGGGKQAAADLAAKAEVAATEGKALAKGVADDAAATAENTVAGARRAAGDAVDDIATGARKTAADAIEATGTRPAQEMKAAKGLLEDLRTVEGQKGIAYDLAFDSIGRGNGLQTTRFAGKAQRYLPNGTRDVGEVMMRKGIINKDAGLIESMRNGTAADMLPKIEAERAVNAQKLHDMTSANPARIGDRELEAAIEAIAKPFDKKAGQKHIAKAVRDYGLDLRQTLGTAAEGPRSGIILRTGRDVSVQELVNQRKALDELVYKEIKALDPNMRVDALRDLRGELEGLVVDSFEKAGAMLGPEAQAAYKALKRDHVALSVAEDLATDSAMRQAKAATLGLRDMLAGGGGVTGLATSFAHKVVRERGSAAGAVLVHRMAALGTISKALKPINDSLERASKGLLAPPAKGAVLEKPVGSVRERADTWLKRVAEAKADPEAFVDKVTRETEAMSVHAPELAGALQKRMTDGIAFMASKMPTPPPGDPLDPRPMPHLTDGEASKIASYAWYVEKPGRFFEEVAAGKLTFEGIEVAKALMPGAFAELQALTAEGIATLSAQGRKPSFNERQKLGALLEFPATPAQHPQHMAFLQKNAMLASQQAQAGSAPAPKRSVQHTSQRSALDRLEASGPGRR
jgi:hypothetical protein